MGLRRKRRAHILMKMTDNTHMQLKTKAANFIHLSYQACKWHQDCSSVLTIAKAIRIAEWIHPLMQNLFLPHRHHNSNQRPLLWVPMQEFFLLIVRRIWAHRQYLSMLKTKEQIQEAIRTTNKFQINLDHRDSKICHHLVLTNR